MTELTIRRSDLTKGQWRLLQSDSPQVLLCGGYGSGKTTGLDLKALQLKAANEGVPGMLVAASWRQMWRVTLRRLLALMKMTYPDRNMIPQVKDKQGECYLDFGDGTPIFLASAHNPESLEGIDVGYLLGDELRLWPKRAYEIAIARRRAKCPFPQSAFSSTPDFNWMANEFSLGTEGRELIVSPTYENEHNLTPGYVDNLKLSYSKRLQRAVIDGQFTVLTGAVYEEFDPLISGQWVIDYNAREYPDRKTYLAVDPGYRRSAWWWVHQVGKTEWVVIDQMCPDDTSDVACVEMVNQRGWPIDEIWCDPAADSTQELTAVSTIRALQLIKARQPKPIRNITGVWRSIPFGVDKMRVLLGGGDLPIRLHFSKECARKEQNKPRGAMRDLAAYRYPEMKDGHPITDMPLKDGISDHNCDAGRYLVVGLFLTSALRDLDPVIKASGKPGYRVAN